MTSGFIEEGQHSVEEYRVSLDHGGASGAPTQTRVHQTRDSRKGERSAGQGPSAGPWLEGFRRNRVALAIEASERKERVRDWTWGGGAGGGDNCSPETENRAGDKSRNQTSHQRGTLFSCSLPSGRGPGNRDFSQNSSEMETG